jgi:hypothetical protein
MNEGENFGSWNLKIIARSKELNQKSILALRTFWLSPSDKSYDVLKSRSCAFANNFVNTQKFYIILFVIFYIGGKK